MKKILTGLLAVVLLFGSVLALSACGKKPQLDLDAAKTALEAKEYAVTLNTDDDLLDVNEEKTLSAYKLDGEGDDAKAMFFRAVVYKDTTSAKLAYKQSKMQLDQMLDEIKLKIEIIEKTIKKYEADMTSDELDELKEDLKDAEEDLAEYEAYCMGRSGKTVWMATNETVVEATKG